MPKYSDVIVKEKEHVSHQAWWIFYNFGHAAGSILGFQQMKKWIGYLLNIQTLSINTTVQNGVGSQNGS
jgi:hypothetical protein